MTRIYLLRHGATALNRMVPYRLQGRATDVSLDDEGREQARRAAGALAGLRLEAIYASPMRRAVETGQAIAEPRGLAVTTVPELTEADVGRWEGKSWDEVAAEDPELYRQFMERPGTTPYAGGESFLDVQHRAVPALARLAARHPGGRIVVVGHNVVNRAYLASVLALPIDRARGIRQENGGISVIDYEEGQPRLVTLNAALHLEGAADG